MLKREKKFDPRPLARDLVHQLRRKRSGLKNIRLTKKGASKHRANLHDFSRSLSLYNTRWWIIGLAIIVVTTGFGIYPTQDIGGASNLQSPRYKTIAQLASAGDLDNLGDPLFSHDEYTMQLDSSGDYLFKTGQTETIISRSTRKETIKYTVREGENLNSLANDFGLTVLTIKYANNLTGNTLKVGQELRIPPIDGLYVQVKKNDTLGGIANKYKVNLDDIQKYNELTTGDPIHVGQELLIPGAVVPKVVASPGGSLPSYNPTPQTAGKFVWPLESPTHFISQGARKGHVALDLNRLNGTSVYASASGVATVKTGYNGGYGNLIIVNHGDGWSTYYAHLNQSKIKNGEYVKQGQLIAIMGTTGRSTGVHLHFEIRYQNKPQNPLNYLPR